MLNKANQAKEILFRLLVYTIFARVSFDLESMLIVFARFIPIFGRQSGHLNLLSVLC